MGQITHRVGTVERAPSRRTDTARWLARHAPEIIRDLQEQVRALEARVADVADPRLRASRGHDQTRTEKLLGKLDDDLATSQRRMGERSRRRR